MNQREDEAGHHEETNGDTRQPTVTIRAYDECTCRVSRFLPNWLNPSYRRTKRIVNAALATDSILCDKRCREVVESAESVEMVDMTQLIDNPEPGRYQYGQTITFTFDTMECAHPEETARLLTRQMIGADNIEVV